MAVRSLGQLTLDLVARTGGFVQGMDKAERRSQKWRRQVEKDLRRVGKAFGAAAVAATAGLAVMTKQGLSFVDSQAKLSTRLESSIDDLRALQIAASDFGIEEERLERSLLSFVKRLGDAERGTGEAKDALADLGLEASELSRMPLADQMALISERISQLDSAAAKASIADRLMTGGRRLVNLFNDGGDAIRAAVQEVDEYGLSLSRVDAQKVEAANDAMARIPRLLEPIKTQLAVAVADPLKAVTDQFLEAGRATGGFRDEVHGVVDDVVDSLLFVVDAGDGVKRVFELAGASLALMVIEGRRDLAQLAESIYSGPVDAINELIRRWNMIPGIDIGSVDQPDFVKDLQQQVALFEGAADAARDDIQSILMRPMASEGIRAAIESARNPATLGGDGEGMINTSAIDAANAVVSAMDRVGSAANAAAEALEDFSPSMNDEVEDILDRAGEGSSIDAQGQIRDAWGNALPTLQRELDGELQRQVDEFQSQSNLKAGLEAAAQAFTAGASAAAQAAWNSVVPQSADQLVAAGAATPAGVLPTGEQTTAPARWASITSDTEQLNATVTSVGQASSGGAGTAATEGKHLGTLTLKSEKGGPIDVQGNADELERWLADTLDGAAGGSR